MPNTLSTPVSLSHLLCTRKLANDVLWGESFDSPLWAGHWSLRNADYW